MKLPSFISAASNYSFSKKPKAEDNAAQGPVVSPKPSRTSSVASTSAKVDTFVATQDAADQAPAAAAKKSFSAQALSGLKTVGKGIAKGVGAVAIAPLVAVGAGLALVIAPFAALIGAVVGAGSVVKEGPGYMALHAVGGFEEGLAMTSNTAKKSFFAMTNLIGLTK